MIQEYQLTHTAKEIDDKLNSISEKANNSDLTAHVDNTSNPHEVTAAQVGAPTVEQMNQAVAAIKVPTKVSELTNDSGYKTTDTTYSNFVKSGSGAKAGLVPAPSTTAGTTKYLREDGTWAVPPDNNTTYTFNGAVSTIKDSDLTASRVLISDSSGKVAVSAVTSTELGYLDGVTSNVQTQINSLSSEIANKAPAYSYGTADMTAGSSTLETGALYFVYE